MKTAIFELIDNEPEDYPETRDVKLATPDEWAQVARTALSAFMTGDYRDGHEIEMPLELEGWREAASSGARVTFTVRDEMLAGGRPCQTLVSCGMTVARKFCHA
jgi:hypothetical protein